jgi:hypothetical protein
MTAFPNDRMRQFTVAWLKLQSLLTAPNVKVCRSVNLISCSTCEAEGTLQNTLQFSCLTAVGLTGGTETVVCLKLL